MFTLKVFHVYAQELEKVYFNQYTKMVRNYTLNKQFCILGCSEGIIICYLPPQKPISTCKKNYSLVLVPWLWAVASQCKSVVK